jgi:hypothetical protein
MAQNIKCDTTKNFMCHWRTEVQSNIAHFINTFRNGLIPKTIHTNHSSIIPEGVKHLRYFSETPSFYQNAIRILQT